MNELKRVSKLDFVLYTRNMTGTPVTTNQNNFAAMQFIVDNVVMAQAVYYKGAVPMYYIRVDEVKL